MKPNRPEGRFIPACVGSAASVWRRGCRIRRVHPQAAVANGSPLLVDTAPIVYLLEGHPAPASRFRPIFERHAHSEAALAVTTVVITPDRDCARLSGLRVLG